VQQVCAESYAVSCINQCCMMAAIHPESDCALTASPMTCMASLN
jgi:hypothetical protein